MRIVPRTYREARDLADQCRARAYQIIDEHRLRECAHREYWRARERKHWWQVWKPPAMTFIPLDVAVDYRVAKDSRWKTAVSDNQWYIQYATMYAQGEQKQELLQLRQDIDILVARQSSPSLNRLLQRSGSDA